MTPGATPRELLGHGDRDGPLYVVVDTEAVDGQPR